MYDEVSVFAENKPGKLSMVAEVLSRSQIDILAFSVADEGQFGVFKMLTAEPLKAREALAAAGMTTALTQVACIEIPDQPGGLLKLAEAIEQTGMNLTNAYGCILERGKRAVFVVKGDNLPAIEAAATAAGLNVLNQL